jgi:hypothetical protein
MAKQKYRVVVPPDELNAMVALDRKAARARRVLQSTTN